MDQIIDEISSTTARSPPQELSQADKDAGNKIKVKVQALKKAMANDFPLEPLPEDGAADIASYNQELSTLDHPKWLSVPWLFSECYLYRLIHTFFTTSTPFWQTFDMFSTDKRNALVGSKKGVIELVRRFRGILQAIWDQEVVDRASRHVIFEEVIQISLWGNATDLSLLTSLSVDELESRQGKAARESSKANVLVDDTELAWILLEQTKTLKEAGDVHIVLDNAGFELLADLVLAGYLLESQFAAKVVLHGKRMPWFVSDVNPGDFTDLIDGFANGTFYEDIDESDKYELQEAGKYWRSIQKSGKLEFHAEPFWTTQHPYGRMAEVDPELFGKLAAADLVIYKGDLNYRKLTYDGLWPRTTPFKQAIGPFARKQAGGKATRIFALRTCKADVGVGLRQGLEKTLPDDWTRTGKYALVSYWDAKS